MIQHVVIIGAGQMGSGIAHVCALAGYNVQLIDISQEQFAKAQMNIEKNLSRQVAKGTITEQEKAKTLSLITFHQAPQQPETIDLALEAVVEDYELKAKILSHLDQLLPPSAILATNTSSISISQLARATKRPSQVIGVHFMNPPPLMPLVEVICGQETSDHTASQIHQMIQKLGKTAVSSKDSPGFIVNRVLMPMINEAIYAVFEEIASAKDIDIAMKLGTNQPMGPLELADFIGLDTCLLIMRVLHAGFGTDKYKPCPLLEEYVAAGRLGKKSGRGFYEYNK